MTVAGSLDGRWFRSAEAVAGGEVGAATRFAYHQHDDLVWARYSGGQVRLGYLVGTRSADRLDFRYTHVNGEGETATGHCTSEIVVTHRGLRLVETWTWESRPGSGTSVLDEVGPES